VGLRGSSRWTREHAAGAEMWHFGGLGVVGNVKGYCRQVGGT